MQRWPSEDTGAANPAAETDKGMCPYRIYLYILKYLNRNPLRPTHILDGYMESLGGVYVCGNVEELSEDYTYFSLCLFMHVLSQGVVSPTCPDR